MTMPAVEVLGFAKSYGGTPAVRGLDVVVERGELFGLIGPDGAGKTTTMRALATLLRPDAGTLRVGGRDTMTESAAVRALLGYMPQRFSLYPDLSVRQNLHFFAELFSVPRRELPSRLARLYRFNALEPYADRLAGRLSGGMKQKLALSCTLIHDPEVLILDEPTTGVDPVSRREFWDILADLRAQGVTLLVSTPYMDEALRCDRIAIMHEGRMLASGRPDELVAGMRRPVFALRGWGALPDATSLDGLPGVLSVQSFGDGLHLTTETGTDAVKLSQAVSAALGRPLQLEGTPPSLEDVFIELIRERGHA